MKKNIMAILTGINTCLRGSVGQYTFQQLNGQTVAKQKIAPKAKPSRTWAQMVRRVMWANLVNLYRSFHGTLHPSFENKDRRKNDFNEFMSANIDSNGVALTSQQARMGGSVVAGYQVTRGSMPSVDVVFGDDQVPVTDIAMGGITIGASTTLRTFSQALLENNPDWEDGDQLTLFVACQSVDSLTSVPRVTMEAKELTLDQNDDGTLLGDLVEANYLTTVNGKLALGGTVNGAIAVVHSRRTLSGTKVSTQFFVVNNPILSQYQSESALKAAVDSYGGVKEDEFLTPNN